MHQIEHVLNYVDGRDITPFDEWGSLLFWGNFVGSDITHTIVKPGCGWTHYPPNGETDYDWMNRSFVESDCEDWKPDGTGETQVFNCEKWKCDSVRFFEWWMQNVPGRGNDLYFDGRKLKNWWSFIGDFDAAMMSGKSLVWPASAAVGGSVTGMTTRNIRCDNKTTGERVSVPTLDDSAWDCEAAGLKVEPGDKIRQIVTGAADGTEHVGGAVTGVDANKVRCYNVSTDRRVSIRLTRGTTTWDCEAAGLRVRTGDEIRQAVQGRAE
jgi:hypothetical protein